VGASQGLVCVYKAKEKLTNPIPIPEALDMLETLIEEFEL